ncbi:2-dehydro-3-deoxyphosphooctonate aldolase isoform X5 [Rosa chinensis]|uniref:2-dehydro-3-deoxyphosphooctonate aldolase isoform X5 n=1 Tax=Rosa chinensis TaxID=74649 RepID=UPI000D096880|nr:2-dehydro-3-deoxyphosphooctonate aldolase isoform X5 [Rosa chinensis]
MLLGLMWLMFSCGRIRSYQEHCSSSSQEKQICSKVKVGLPLVFKSSFDKANRTTSKSFRGPGMVEGLKILKKVKIAFDLPIVTNVHEFIQCEEVGKLSCRYHSDSCIFMPSEELDNPWLLKLELSLPKVTL